MPWPRISIVLLHRHSWGWAVFPDRSPLARDAGHARTYYANMAISHCDLLIAVGVRFDDRVTSKVEAFAPHARIVHIDIDPVSVDKTIKAHVSIVGDCKPILQLLNQWLTNDRTARPEEQTQAWLDEIAQ